MIILIFRKMQQIFSKQEIKQTITTILLNNSSRMIDNVFPNVWINRIYDSILTGTKIFNCITAVADYNVNVRQIRSGYVIAGKKLIINNVVLLMNQNYSFENGVYIVKTEAEELIRHPLFPNYRSIDGYQFVMPIAQTGIGNMFFTLIKKYSFGSGSGSLSGSGDINSSGSGSLTDEPLIYIINNEENPSFSADGILITSGFTEKIIFRPPLYDMPAKIKITIWDSDGMPVTGGYSPSEISSLGMTINIPGNEDEVTVIYNVEV